MMATYYHRYVRDNIAEALLDTPVIFITGPRQSGKTTLAKSLISEEWKYITLDDQTQWAIAKADPVGFITNLREKHIVIDEVQRVPELFLTIKQVVDENRSPGRFLLTGSSNALALPQVADSLAGRIETILLNTLSECEINNTTPSFLHKLLSSELPETKHIRIRDFLIKRITTGCYPEPLQRPTENRVISWYNQYINSLIQKDLKDIEHIDYPEKMLNLLKLTAYYSSKLVNYSELGNKLNLDGETIKKYTGLLKQLFLLDSLPAWHTNEYKRLVKTPKLHFVDTGLICAIRNINSERLLKQPGDLGSLLETFIYNELRKQATWETENLIFYHYRDKDKVEVDFIIENMVGDCFAVEVKATATLTSKDFIGLNRFRDIVGKRFKFGVLLYDGDHTTSYSDNLYAVPLAAVWS